MFVEENVCDFGDVLLNSPPSHPRGPALLPRQRRGQITAGLAQPRERRSSY